MFSKDNTHYRSVPRTMNEAFGPYSKLSITRDRNLAAGIAAAVGVITLGVIYGLLFAWRG